MIFLFPSWDMLGSVVRGCFNPSENILDSAPQLRSFPPRGEQENHVSNHQSNFTHVNICEASFSKHLPECVRNKPCMHQDSPKPMREPQPPLFFLSLFPFLSLFFLLFFLFAFLLLKIASIDPMASSAHSEDFHQTKTYEQQHQ